MGTSISENGFSKASVAIRRPVLAAAAVFFHCRSGRYCNAGRAEYRSGAGDWIGLIQGYIKDGGLVLGLAIAVLGFLWIAYLGFAKFNEARRR